MFSLFVLNILFFSVVRVECHYNIHDHGHEGHQHSDQFSNDWVVHLGESDVHAAKTFARQMGYLLIEQIPGFANYYLMRKLNHPISSDRNADSNTQKLQQDGRVLWAQQLFLKVRVKRDFLDDNDVSISGLFASQEDLERLYPGIPVKLDSSKGRNVQSEEEDPRGIPVYLSQLWDQVDEKGKKASGGDSQMFNDEQWKKQWYMNSRHRRSLSDPEVDLRVLQVYKAFHLTGKGIRVLVLDDGLEHTHPDIVENYDPSISFDYNNGTSGDSDPFPDKSKSYPNSHGTRCAGEIAMMSNNHICGVGVAYEASIGAIRMLDGVVNDRVEGLSLQHAIDKVDIISASWGPNDDGKTVEGPGRMAQTAIINGISKGRQGKGLIYVWASGNGGQNFDNCNCDGYASSMFTISIGSATERGKFPWYGEKCATTIATTFSSGNFDEKKVATIDTNDQCTEGHTGTSAAAPLAAGIIALVLQKNPLLTWRDVQHLVVWSSSIESVLDNPGWFVNGAGLPYNHRFGFGVMDAYRMVSMATQWTNVERQRTCIVELESLSSTSLFDGQATVAAFITNGCSRDSEEIVKYLEHVEVIVSLDYEIRGNLEIILESPSGTLSQLLTLRPKDRSNEGFKNWKFTSVHFWGENPAGLWQLYITDRQQGKDISKKVDISQLRLLLYGTDSMPEVANDQTSSMKSTLLAKGQSQPSEKNIEVFLDMESPLQNIS